MTKLICPDCQHENETERIYCHNCGARLDRSGLAKQKIEEGSAEEQTRQHLQKMLSPHRGLGKQIALQFVKVLLGAVCLAAVIVMLLPPDIPPAPKTYDFAPMISMDMVSALSSQQPATLSYNEDQVNAYLASNLRRKDSPSQQGLFPLRRVFVQFDDGHCIVNTERPVFDSSRSARPGPLSVVFITRLTGRPSSFASRTISPSGIATRTQPFLITSTVKRASPVARSPSTFNS